MVVYGLTHAAIRRETAFGRRFLFFLGAKTRRVECNARYVFKYCMRKLTTSFKSHGRWLRLSHCLMDLGWVRVLNIIYTLNQLNLVLCVISHSLDRLFYVCKSTQNIYHDQSKYNLNQMFFSNLWIISHQILFIWITLILRGWTLVGTPI